MKMTSQPKNIDSPFTELFLLLTRYKQSPQGASLVYESNELELMQCHLGNGIEMLLQGMQSLGEMISATFTAKNKKNLANIGNFIAGISNLIEALNSIQWDAAHELKQRSKVDYSGATDE